MNYLLRKSITALSLLALSVGTMSAATVADDVLAALKSRIAPDSRTAVWDVKTVNQAGSIAVYGTVGVKAQQDSIHAALNAAGIGYTDRLVVLDQSVKKPWAFVKLSIATLRTAGKHAAEAATQGIMGMPVKVIEDGNDWYRVQTPDNYIAYIPSSSVQFVSESELKAWEQSKRCIVTVYDSRLVAEPGSDETVSDLVLGCILTYKNKKGKWTLLETPDGRQGWVENKDIADFETWSKQDLDLNLVEKTAKRMMGSGYLWGGTSTKVTDCSGLAKVSYFSTGVILQRDASQQALTGKIIKAEDWRQAQLGDLVFFGSNSGRVTHVGIYLRNGLYIHCSGRVKINSVDPEATEYLTTPFLSISRIAGEIGTTGITYVRNHPWYFIQK